MTKHSHSPPPSPLKQQVRALMTEMTSLQMKVLSLGKEQQDGVGRQGIPELVDCGFMWRELATMFDEMRKCATSREELLSRFIAAKHGQATLMGQTPPKLEGELATGVADVSTKPRLPKRGSPEYYQLLEWLGVSEELAKQDVLSFSYTKVQEMVLKRLSEGQQAPPGIDAQHVEALVIFRRKSTKSKKNERSEQS